MTKYIRGVAQTPEVVAPTAAGYILVAYAMTKKSKVAGEADDSFRRPKSATVFHISQTEVAA